MQVCIIRMWLLFKGGSNMRKYGMYLIWLQSKNNDKKSTGGATFHKYQNLV